MKKGLFILCALGFFSGAYGQYSTPRTGVNWNMDSLVTHSAGTVVTTSDGYRIKRDLTIDSSDVLRITQNTKITLDSMVLFTVSKGGLTVNPPTGVLFTATDTTKRFKGFRFAETDDILLKKATVEFGGGIKISGSDAVFDSCIIRKNSKAYTSGAIDISTGNPVITNSTFHHNERSAISSGANLGAAPVIRNNVMYFNVMDNSNRPQINLGPSGASDTTIIVGNTITGQFPVSGGISFSSLLGVASSGIIDSNIIRGNRYGITVTGANLFTKIRYNIIEDNNIQNNPAQGGSGISFQSAGGNNNSIVAYNEIRGNLWGITIIDKATPNLGNNTPSSPGFNIIENNMNGTQLGDLYNNTKLPVSAQNNCWGNTVDSAVVETLISHNVDDTALGLVTFMPVWDCHDVTMGITENVKLESKLFPNPASDVLNIDLAGQNGTYRVALFTGVGALVSQEQFQVTGGQIQLPVDALTPGLYLLRLTDASGATKTHRLLISR